MMFSDELKTKIVKAKQSIQSTVGVFQIKYSVLPRNDMSLNGGAIASILQGEKPCDWVIYCKESDTSERVSDILKY